MYSSAAVAHLVVHQPLYPEVVGLSPAWDKLFPHSCAHFSIRGRCGIVLPRLWLRGQLQNCTAFIVSTKTCFFNFFKTEHCYIFSQCLSLYFFSHFCSFMVIRRLGFKGWGHGGRFKGWGHGGCFLFGGSLYKHRGKPWEKIFAKRFVIIGVLSVLISNLALFLSSTNSSLCVGHDLANILPNIE